MKRFTLVKNAFDTIISVPKRIWDRFNTEKTVSRSNVVRNGAIATALVAALSGGVSSTALAEDGSLVDNGQEVAIEQTYEEPVVEMTITEEPVVETTYEEPVYTETTYEEPVYVETTYEEPVYVETTYEEPVQETYVEETNVEVSAEEQTVSEEVSAEQMNVEVSTEEQTASEEVSAEQVNTEVSTSGEATESEQSVEMSITENTSSQEEVSNESVSASSESTVSTESGCESSEQTEIIKEVSSGEYYETTESEYTTSVAFTVVEKNGVPYIFTDAKDDEESQKLLSQKINEWMEAHYGSSQLKNHVYSISSLGVGTQTVGEDNLVVSIDKNGNVSIIDTEVTETVELDNNLEIIDIKENDVQSDSKEDVKKDETKTESKTTDSTQKETKSESKTTDSTQKETKTESQESTQVNTRTVSIADDDYIIITGKDGSVTIGYKYTLGAKGYAEILKSLNLPADVKVNTPILLPAKSEEGIAKKNSMTAGGITISTEDGINYVLSGDGVSDVKLGKDSTKQLDNAANESKNGDKDDGGKSKADNPDHDVPPTPENPPKEEVPPTPENPPKKEVPPTPENPPKKEVPPTPENPSIPENPTPNTPNIPSYTLPKTNDLLNTGLINAFGGLGITSLAAGIGVRIKNKYKLLKNNFRYGIVYKDSINEKVMIDREIKNRGYHKLVKSI